MATQVDPSNNNQFTAWDGSTGDFWAERAQRFNEGVTGYQQPFLDAAEIQENSTILDIGCGSGQTTRDAARRAPSGTALGVDLSSRAIELASRFATEERVPNATFDQLDAQVHPFPEAHFDIVVSRHGAMFFGDAPAAFRNIARSMRPGALMTLLTWQDDEYNEWTTTFRTILLAGRERTVRPDRPGQLKNADQAGELLPPAGFTDLRVTELNVPMYFGQDPDDACGFISAQNAAMLAGLDEDTRTSAVEALRADMAKHQTAHGVYYGSAGLLVQARRTA